MDWRISATSTTVTSRSKSTGSVMNCRIRGTRPDDIVSLQTPTSLALKDAITDIPIIISAVSDPIVAGIVPSLARPGGNITGLSLMLPETAGKRVQFMTELVPGMSQLAVVIEATNESHRPIAERTQRAGEVLGVDVRVVAMPAKDGIDAMFKSLAADGVEALIVAPEIRFGNLRKEIVEAALNNRLPLMATARAFPAAGGLIAYGPNFVEHFRRPAYFVDRILNGAKPADLPIEQPTVFELIINLKTAKELGITIPPALMIRATEFIE